MCLFWSPIHWYQLSNECFFQPKFLSLSTKYNSYATLRKWNIMALHMLPMNESREQVLSTRDAIVVHQYVLSAWSSSPWSYTWPLSKHCRVYTDSEHMQCDLYTNTKCNLYTNRCASCILIIVYNSHPVQHTCEQICPCKFKHIYRNIKWRFKMIFMNVFENQILNRNFLLCVSIFDILAIKI